MEPAEESELPMSAEQFWSISRGPPDQQEKKIMTCIMHDPAVRNEPSAFGPDDGGFPWA
ncbi:hypothetical protein ACFQBU_11840 [Jhaorihella thermophila]